MAITARVVWKGASEPPAELDFAYPLAIGETFILQIGEEKCVCTLEVKMQNPILHGEEGTPMVIYLVKRTAVSTMKKKWWPVVESLKDLAKSALGSAAEK